MIDISVQRRSANIHITWKLAIFYKHFYFKTIFLGSVVSPVRNSKQPKLPFWALQKWQKQHFTAVFAFSATCRDLPAFFHTNIRRKNAGECPKLSGFAGEIFLPVWSGEWRLSVSTSFRRRLEWGLFLNTSCNSYLCGFPRYTTVAEKFLLILYLWFYCMFNFVQNPCRSTCLVLPPRFRSSARVSEWRCAPKPGNSWQSAAFTTWALSSC